MPWWYILLLAVVPAVGFCVGYIVGRDHEGRVHATRRRSLSDDDSGPLVT